VEHNESLSVDFFICCFLAEKEKERWKERKKKEGK